MAVVQINTVIDRFKHELVRCHPTIDADVGLQPTNLYNNWTLAIKSVTGDPDGLVIGMPEQPEGFMVYVSQVDDGPTTLSAHNVAPVDLGDPSYLIDTPPVLGDYPATSTTAAKIAPPEFSMDNIEIVPASKVGWAVGDYYVAYTWMHGKEHTRMSPFTTVHIDSPNQFMEVPIPDSPPDGATAIGIWVSAPNKGPETARLQKIQRLKYVIPASIELKGPWFKRDKQPSRNQTRRHQPRTPGITRRKGHRVGKAGTFQVSTAFVDAFGNESDRSEWSDPITITESDAQRGHHVGIDFAEYIPPEEDYPGTTTIRIYVLFNGKEYRLEKKSKKGTGSSDRHSSDDDIVFSGRTEPEAEDGEDTVLGFGSHRRHRRRQGRGGRGSEKDASTSSSSSSSSTGQGLDDPTTPLDTITVTGKVLISANPGKYWIALAYYVRDRVTMISEPVQVTLAAGQTIRVNFNNSTNLLTNAQFQIVDGDGKPAGWTLDYVGGNVAGQGTWDARDEYMQLSTDGTRAVQQNAPKLSSHLISVDDRSTIWTLGGSIQTNLNQGSGYARVVELDNNLQPIGTPRVLRSATGASSVRFEYQFDPSDQSKSFNANTAYIQLVFDFGDTSAARFGVMNVSDLYVFKHPNRLRRFEATDDPQGGDNADPSPSVPWPAWSYKSIGTPANFNRVPPEVLPIEVVDFTNGVAPGFPAGWTQRAPGATGLTVEARAQSAIDLTPGLHIVKTSAATLYGYFSKMFGTTRTNLAYRMKYRVRALPSYGEVTIMEIKQDAGDDSQAGNWLGKLTISADGEVRAYYFKGGGRPNWGYYVLTSNVRVNDILDLEMILSGGNSTKGQFQSGVGMNGQTRSMHTPITNLNWTARYPRTIQFGLNNYTVNKTTVDLDFDVGIVTESGAPVVETKPTATMESLILPDRPPKDPAYIETYKFEDGTIPGAFTQGHVNNTGGNISTGYTIAAGGSYALEGNYGVRIADTQTGVQGNIYISRALTAARPEAGWRVRFRVVARPTVGSVKVASVRNDGNVEVAAIDLDASGNMHLVVTAQFGVSPTPVIIAQGVQNGERVTIEIVVHNVGLTTGAVEAFVSHGTTDTGSIGSRQLMTQPVRADLSGTGARHFRVGVFGESQNTATATLDFDDLAITEQGEVLFWETAEDGTLIEQAYMFYVEGQPVRDDLGPRGMVRAVKPGATYVAYVWMRYADVTDVCWPFTLTAYSADDEPFELGSVVGDAGISGTAGWALYTLQFVVPKKGDPSPDGGVYEKDCVEVQVTSPGIGSGEFVIQIPGISPGAVPIWEVTYSDDGFVVVTLETKTPALDPGLSASIENRWLDLGAILDVPDGCSTSITYGSTDEKVQPAQWYTAEADVPQRRYVHFKIRMYSDSTNRRTPMLRSGSPYVNYADYWAATQLPVLLRGDFTEFPGGAFVPDFILPVDKPDYDILNVKGYTVRHKRTDKIKRADPCTVTVHTEEARLEIVNSSDDDEFVMEYEGKWYRLKLTDEVDWSVDNSNRRKDSNGYTYVDAQVSLPQSEVTEVMTMPTGIV